MSVIVYLIPDGGMSEQCPFLMECENFMNSPHRINTERCKKLHTTHTSKVLCALKQKAVFEVQWATVCTCKLQLNYLSNTVPLMVQTGTWWQIEKWLLVTNECLNIHKS